MPLKLETLLERMDPAAVAGDSIEGTRLHRAVRARLLDETVAEVRIDRFVITARLGVGGMGVVYAATDEQLDRKVAIKLLRNWDAEQTIDERRLVREARALAQLSHPNVVAIYDVGLHDGRIFIAMEYVPGTTLRKHVVDLDWQQITECYRQAGEGLAAAHAVGLVHRDFKPDNALVGEDGRVRVLDFGLAYGDAALVGDSASAPDLPISASQTATSLTLTGKVVGTPAYMAAEQFAGAPADPRTDQFSFCVAFWEALHAERPFVGKTVTAVRQQIADGCITEPAHPERAPEWLRAVLSRGLAVDPARRWPSMPALLEACMRPPTRRRRWLVVLGLLGGTAAIALGAWSLVQQHRRDACTDDAAALAAIWNDETSEEVTAAFTSTELAHAGRTAQLLDRVLDTRAQEWADAHAGACRARVDGTLDDHGLSLRRGCLDDHREQLATLLEILAQPNRDVVNNSMRAAFDLPRAERCEDDARLAANAAVLGDEIALEDVAALRRRLARNQQLASARPQEAKTLALAAHAEAAALGDPALEAETLLGVGIAHVRLGEYAEAATAYERAYFLASPVGADEVSLFASTRLVEVVGYRLSRFDDALAWARHADVLLSRMGEGSRWLAADLAENIGSALRGKGDYAGARASYERSIALRIEDVGPDHPSVGRTLTSLGGMLVGRHETEAAAEVLDRAEQVLLAAYGPDALAVATVYGARASVELLRTRYAESLGYSERSLAIYTAALEPDHPLIAQALGNIGMSKLTLGDLAGARVAMTRAVEIRRKRLGPLDPSLAISLSNLGVIESHALDYTAAEAHLTEALQIRRASLPPEHPDIAVTLNNLGDVQAAQKHHAPALALYSEAAQLVANGDGEIEAVRGRALAGVGTSWLALGDANAALDALERAMATRYADDDDPISGCALRLALASALVATGGPRSRVEQLARRADELCIEAGPRAASTRAEIAALLK